MGREDFGRAPIARPYDEDYIPAIVYPDELSCDPNTPDAEVQFEDARAKHASIFLDFHNNNGEQELEIVCGFNSARRELLNDALKEMMAVHGTIKTLAVTMATQNARAHALFFIQNGFTRAADRSRNTWTYVCDLAEHRQRKKERKPRAKKIVDIKSEPVQELKPLLTVEQYRQKCAELDRLRALLNESYT